MYCTIAYIHISSQDRERSRPRVYWVPAMGVRVLIDGEDTSFYRHPVRTWTAMISVPELVHTFDIGRNCNLARISYVTDGHIYIYHHKMGKCNRRGDFCKVSGEASMICVIELSSSHILHERYSNLARTYVTDGYIYISSQDGECNHRGDFWKGLGAPSIICGLELVRTFYLRHCNLRRTLLVYNTNPQIQTFAGSAVELEWQSWV